MICGSASTQAISTAPKPRPARYSGKYAMKKPACTKCAP
jgi:hypothetical protein